MSDEKPLRVQVAEAEGWTEIERTTCSVPSPHVWWGRNPAHPTWIKELLPPFGENTPDGRALTIDLQQKYNLRTEYRSGNTPPAWAKGPAPPDLWACGAHIPEAVARCVVALAAAKKANG